MQRDVLNSEQVVARGNVLGDRHADGSLVCDSLALCLNGHATTHTQARPTQLIVRRSRLLSIDLEPDTPCALPHRGRGTRRDFGHVELQWAGVEDVGRGLEAYTAASSYALCLGSAPAGAGVASNCFG